MISIIIPTYNRKELLEESIQSVLNQTYQDFELIVSDDGSTDGTNKMIKSISDQRVRYLYNSKRYGAPHARNKGIENAKGEYIAFQDSDDIWYPEKLEKQMSFLTSNNAYVVFCNYNVIRIDGSVHQRHSKLKEGKITYEQLLKRSLASTQAIMGKAECFKDIRFDENLKRLQDWDLILKLGQKYDVFYQNEILFDKYSQPDSISNDPLLLFDSMRKIYDTYIRPISNDIVNSNIDQFYDGYEAWVAEYSSLQKRYEEVLNSKTWKLTSPFRKLIDKIKNIK